MDLDAEQQAAAFAPLDKPVLVIAGPGSGKTRTLAARVHHIISSGAPPASIVVTTFTKRAGEELRDRLTPMLGSSVNDLRLGTIHATCFRILREEGRARNPLDPYQQKRLIDEIIGPKGLHWDVGWKFPAHWIACAKSGLIGPVESREWFLAAIGQAPEVDLIAGNLATTYEHYERDKLAMGAMDFGDMLMWTRLALHREPAFRARWQQKVTYVLLDEAQDTSAESIDVLALLAAPENRVFAVGDPRQMLFRFAGASPEESIWRFRELFPGASVLTLRTNYRSTRNIVKATNSLASEQFKGHTVEEDRRLLLAPLLPSEGALEGVEVLVDEYDNDLLEAYEVSKQIAEMISGGEREPRDFFVIYRTNAQSAAMEGVLTGLSIPYVVQGGLGFYQRAHVKDVLCYLRLVQDTGDNEAFQRVANIASAQHDRHTRGFGRVWMDQVKARSVADGKSMWEAMQVMDLPFWQRKGVADFVRAIASIRASALIENANQDDLIDGREGPTYDPRRAAMEVRSQVYDSYLLRSEGPEEEADGGKLDDLEALVRGAGGHRSLASYLAHVASIQEATGRTRDGSSNLVVLTTVHKAKGLERPVVFGISLSEGILPHYRALSNTPVGLPLYRAESRHGEEDERCVAFVMLSRAQDLCILSWIRGRVGDNDNARSMEPSRFLWEMGLRVPIDGVLVDSWKEPELEEGDNADPKALESPSASGSTQGAEI